MDLVVTEILDAGLLGEHILPSLRHAHAHLLAPDGRIIPRGATVFATCVSSADLRRRLYVSADSLAMISHLLFAHADAGLVDASTSCLDGIRDAVGLDHGEQYDTVWLHRLHDCRYLTPPAAVLDIDFASVASELELPPLRTTAVDVVSSGEVDAVVSWFRLDLDATRSLHTGPDATDEGNSCWEQAVHLAPRWPKPLHCEVGDCILIDARRTETSPHFEIRMPKQRLSESASRATTSRRENSHHSLQIGEAAIRRLNDKRLHQSFDEAIRWTMKQLQESGAGARVLDMRGDWACSAVSALQLGASYVLATHVSDAIELSRPDEQLPPASGPQVDGYWKTIMSSAAAAVAGSKGTIEFQSAGIGEMLVAGWEPPFADRGQSEPEACGPNHQREGFDIIVTELVDCMGVLVEGVLDDLQLAMQLSGASRHVTTEDTAAGVRGLPRRILTVPQRAVVYAQLISSSELRNETRVSTANSHNTTCGLDVGAINDYSIESYMDLDLMTLPHKALSSPFEAFSIDTQQAADEFMNAQSEDGGVSTNGGHGDMDWQRSLLVDWVGSVDITGSGTLDAVVYWFELELTPELKLSTGPGVGLSCWKQAATVLSCNGGRDEAGRATRGRVVSVGEQVTIHGAVIDSSVRFMLG